MFFSQSSDLYRNKNSVLHSVWTTLFEMSYITYGIIIWSQRKNKSFRKLSSLSILDWKCLIMTTRNVLISCINSTTRPVNIWWMSIHCWISRKNIRSSSKISVSIDISSRHSFDHTKITWKIQRNHSSVKRYCTCSNIYPCHRYSHHHLNPFRDVSPKYW